jgi:hypothetical protein
MGVHPSSSGHVKRLLGGESFGTGVDILATVLGIHGFLNRPTLSRVSANMLDDQKSVSWLRWIVDQRHLGGSGREDQELLLFKFIRFKGEIEILFPI